LHPTTYLIAWLWAVLVSQCLHLPALLAFLILLLGFGAAVIRLWLAYCRRARWLVLSLWLILAWHVPGEALWAQAWLPTHEGLVQASEQTLRLLVVFACLAWVYARIGRDGVLSGLWGGLRPLARLGVDSERLVVRLALVLDNVQQAQPADAWKHWLAGDGAGLAGAPQKMQLQLPGWQRRDYLALWVMALVFVGGGLA